MPRIGSNCSGEDPGFYFNFCFIWSLEFGSGVNSQKVVDSTAFCYYFCIKSTSLWISLQLYIDAICQFSGNRHTVQKKKIRLKWTIFLYYMILLQLQTCYRKIISTIKALSRVLLLLMGFYFMDVKSTVTMHVQNLDKDLTATEVNKKFFWLKGSSTFHLFLICHLRAKSLSNWDTCLK